MCFPNNRPPKEETRSVGDAEWSAMQGNPDGYSELGGLEGDAIRAGDNRIDPTKFLIDSTSPVSSIGALASRVTPKIAIGKLKHNPIESASAPLIRSTPAGRIPAPQIKPGKV